MSRFRILGNTPPVVKNIIIINVIMVLATYVLASQNMIDLTDVLGMHFYKSEHFKIWQLITHMFMHSITDPFHILLNMYALWMFGQVLEFDWGGKRFLFYYLVTGIGAVLFNMLVQYFEFSHLAHIIDNYALHPNFSSFIGFLNKYLPVQNRSEAANDFIRKFSAGANDAGNLSDSVQFLRGYLTEIMDAPLVGASGAVFGVLLAFGMLHPNTELMLIFPPIPIKAKWAVIGYGAIELYSGVKQPGSNIAHFAHLGGMLFGFLLIKYWQTNRKTFY
jgi:membrane associated rhomboid family serine protease